MLDVVVAEVGVHDDRADDLEGLANADLVHEEERFAFDDELAHLRDADDLMPPWTERQGLAGPEERGPRFLCPRVDHAARVLDDVQTRNCPLLLQAQPGPKIGKGHVLEVLDAGQPVREVEVAVGRIAKCVEVTMREAVDGQVELAQDHVHRRRVREGLESLEEAGGNTCKSNNAFLVRQT